MKNVPPQTSVKFILSSDILSNAKFALKEGRKRKNRLVRNPESQAKGFIG